MFKRLNLPFGQYIPKFMKTFQMKMFLLGVTGFSTYKYYEQRNEEKMNHPIIHESIRYLETKKDVRELIGTPIHLVHTVKNRAYSDKDSANFSFKVKGPRGELKVELSGISQTLDNIGLTREAKDYLKHKMESPIAFF